jgi:hypothetical protein
MEEIKKFNEFIKEDTKINIKYGLIVLNREDLENGIYEILHFVGYEEKPTDIDITSLVDELKTDETFGLTELGKNMIIIEAADETVDEYRNIINGVNINEGKAEDVEHDGNKLKYRSEHFPGFNTPKRYEGKGKYKYRVLAREGDKIKCINFGKNVEGKQQLSKLSKKYWDATWK